LPDALISGTKAVNGSEIIAWWQEALLLLWNLSKIIIGLDLTQ